MADAKLSPLMRESDKFFWHGYIDFYEQHFNGRDIRSIAEFGVFKGNSIRWLIERFPNAKIDGLDILPLQPEWPSDPRITYHRIDQGDRAQIRSFFLGRKFELIIEDGSHIPEHQVNCLIEGLPKVMPGGIYILEDIHTSHPTHETFGSRIERYLPKINPKGTALSTLLALDHFRRINRSITAALCERIARNSLIGADQVASLDRDIEHLHLYRRSHLPDKCYRCGSTEYQFNKFRCVCGVEIFAQADSMSFVIHRKG